MTTPRLTEQVRIESKPTVTGLPLGLYVEYFGVLKDGTEFVIYRPAEDWDYKDFRVLLKIPPDALFTLHEIANIRRFRDGGTTEIEIKYGAFYFPSSLYKDKVPSFNGEELTLYG